MKQVLIRALPFFITFVFGVAVAAIFGVVLPRHHKWERDCSKKYKAALRMGTVSNGARTFAITRIQRSGEKQISLWVSKEQGWTRADEEDTLYVDTMKRAGCCSDSEFAISYGSLKPIDGQPVSADAVVTSIPRPRFWADEQRASRLECNAMLQVDLDGSGTVTSVKIVEKYTDSCRYIDDIVEAARNITFQPALRDGAPVSEQVAVFYTLR